MRATFTAFYDPTCVQAKCSREIQMSDSSKNQRIQTLFRPSNARWIPLILAVFWTTSFAISQPPVGESPTKLGSEWVPKDATDAQESGSIAAFPAMIEKATPPARVGAAGEIIGFTGSDASGSQTITLVHTGKSWMAVYHIDRSGKIRLVSSRSIDADFTLQLNATAPLPEDIRELGGRR